MSSTPQERAAKLLRMIEGAGTAAESQAAALALQRLLAENGMSMADVANDGDGRDEAPVELGTAPRSRYPRWMIALATVIAYNFRAKVFIDTVPQGPKERQRVVFFGLSEDIELAKRCYEVFTRAANKLFRTWRDAYRRETGLAGRLPASVENTWYDAFVLGIKDAFSEQVASDGVLALAIACPKRVEDGYEALGLVDYPRRAHKVVRNASIRNAGYGAGYGVASGDRVDTQGEPAPPLTA